LGSNCSDEDKDRTAEQIKGHAAMAAEVGGANLSVIKLLRAGLNSREAAITAVTATEAAFIAYKEMLEWLRSDLVELMSKIEDWPTKKSLPAWLQFFNTKKGNRLKLTCQTQVAQMVMHGQSVQCRSQDAGISSNI